MKSNNPTARKTNLAGIACWASFAVWKSVAGARPAISTLATDFGERLQIYE